MFLYSASQFLNTVKGVRTKRRKSEKVLKVENIKMASTSTKFQKKFKFENIKMALTSKMT